MLQEIRRVATPKLAPIIFLRYFQTIFIMRGGGLVSDFMWAIADVYQLIEMEKCEVSTLLFTSTYHNFWKSPSNFFYLHNDSIFCSLYQIFLLLNVSLKFIILHFGHTVCVISLLNLSFYILATLSILPGTLGSVSGQNFASSVFMQ